MGTERSVLFREFRELRGRLFPELEYARAVSIRS
jgi:hypothetical protein